MKKSLLAALCVLSATAPVFAASDMPVDRVILSSSGLANFVHKAKVAGDAEVSFPVRFEQVDDIMKSLIVFDSKGRLGAVTLPGRQPLDQIFKDLPFTREQIQSPILLLNAYQGAVVTIKGPSSQITGKLVRVEPEMAVTKDGAETRHRISVLADAGLRQAMLEEVQSIQFDDARIRKEISRALEAIRDYGTQERRNLNVSLKGAGSRDVTLSYVVEAPLWKTAYRLVIPEAGDSKGLLQGWAVVENMTAGDWENVDLTLVSGNPVTFRQALYASYYVPRPEIPVQVFGRVMPRVDSGAVSSAPMSDAAAEADSFNGPARFAKGKSDMAMAASPMMLKEESVSNESRLAMGGYGGMDNVVTPASAAESADAATQVLFRFPDRMSVKSGQSMMVPFVSRSVPMRRVALYQPDVQPRHPLAAVEMTNDGDAGLPAGVLTLYEESALLKGTAFVGDAQLPAISVGEKRLVSFAVDSKVKVNRDDAQASTQGKVSIAKGVLKQSSKTVLTTTYTIEAPKTEPRHIIVEHPKTPGYTLVQPDVKKLEETPTHYRIAFDVKAGDVIKPKVVQEQENWSHFQILDMSSDHIALFLTGDYALSAPMRAALKSIAAARAEMDTIQGRINQLNGEKQEIFNDQSRLRQNLETLTAKSDLRDKYLSKMNAQEDRLADIEDDIKDAQKKYNDARQKLQDMIASIDL
jgi:hypothetical protein